MMDYKKLREEKLREAACLGDLKTLQDLILSGVDVNAKNAMNGWTALHWAACRGNLTAVSILLKSGADQYSVTHKGENPCYLASSDEVRRLFDGYTNPKKEGLELPIIPNYLRNPPLNCSTGDYDKTLLAKDLQKECQEGLVLRLLVEEYPKEFVEIEIPASELTFESLKRICAKELWINADKIAKIIKLPNTRVRNDKDVLRLKDFEEIHCLL